MNYRFDIIHRGDGSVRVSCGEHTHHSEHGLARKLVVAGLPDGPIEAGRVGRVDYRVGSLHAFASRVLRETDRGFSHGWYAARPGDEVPSALQDAISRTQGVVQKRRLAMGAV